MLHLSLALNILVLTPLLWALAQNVGGMTDVYGPDSAARRILAAVYFAILLMSVGLLAAMVFTTWQVVPVAVTLLTLQVIYKVSTAVVLDLSNPVVIANLTISAVHGVTLVTLMR